MRLNKKERFSGIRIFFAVIFLAFIMLPAGVNAEDGNNIGNYDSGEKVGEIYVSMENTTFPEVRHEEFRGTFLSGTYDLGKNDSCMTVLLKVLHEKGYSWTGTGNKDPYKITYLSSVYKDLNNNGKKDESEPQLGEFDGGPQSGWMITMNDFFINESAANFNATAEKRDYRLSDGDTVSWQYTSKGLGADLGGVFGNSDTSLKALDVEGGELIRPFDGSVKEYMLLLDGNKAQMKFTPHAANRNYLTKIFLNKYDDSSAEYKRTKTFTVNNGNNVYVGCGEHSWPSMNNQSSEAIPYNGTKYTLHAVNKNDGEAVGDMIDSLIESAELTSESVEQLKLSFKGARDVYEVLSPDEKDKVDPRTLKALTGMEEEIASIERIKDAAAKLAEVPKIENPTEEQVIANERVIRAAKTAYDKLSSEERKSLKIADVKNYQGFAKILVKMDLAAAKSVALKKLERYNPSDYRTAERDILIAIIAEASSAIKAENNIKNVENILSEAESKIKKLKTAAQYVAEERLKPRMPEKQRQPVKDKVSPEKSVADPATEKRGMISTARSVKLALKGIKKSTKFIRFSWKNALQVSGYRIERAKNRKFTAGKKTFILKRPDKNAYVVRKLKRKTTYYIRFRTYTQIDGKKYYGKWLVFKVKTK